MTHWKKAAKKSIVAGVAGGTALAAGGYGIAAAAPFNHHDRRTIAGKVTAVSSGGFTVTTRRGAVDPVLTTSSTRYHERGSPVAPSGVVDGEQVIVYLTGPARDADNSTSTSGSSTTTGAAATPPTASVVDILLASERGEVKSVSGGTITLSEGSRSARTVDTTGSTAYYQDGKAASASAVVPGDLVAAYGTRAAGGTLDASVVDIYTPPKRFHPSTTTSSTTSTTSVTGAQPAFASWLASHRDWSTTTTTAPASGTTTSTSVDADRTRNAPAEWTRVGGKVTSVSGDTITISDPDSSAPATVTVTPSTRYFDGDGPASLSSVATGDFITATGTRSGTDSITAAVVEVRSATPPATPPAHTGSWSNPPAPNRTPTPPPSQNQWSHSTPTTAPAPSGDRPSGYRGSGPGSSPGGSSAWSGHSGGR